MAAFLSTSVFGSVASLKSTRTPLPVQSARMSTVAKGQEVQGVVVSNKMTKTIVVRVSRRAVHPKYKKRTTISKKVMAHDETEMCEEGQVVRLEAASKKMSARKRWVVAEICAPQGCEGM
mmetsp:Transcript_30576/g.58915  ORF Transcript_30576/g.58915 Transcript_30576/m.58915 type:complete len:120 (+) Transcript_30576:105-464(+)